MNCKICGVELTGRRTSFCSTKCANKHSNSRHQHYEAQRARGMKRKLDLVERAGGACTRCGYKKNSAALQFHHVDESDKSFELDTRNCSNRSWEALLEEFEKCVLLCANCHMEEHHPDCNLE